MLDNAEVAKAATGDRRVAAMLVLPKDASSQFAAGVKRSCTLDKASAAHAEGSEAVLNHISGSRGGIAGVYQRHDWPAEKRAALDSWGAHVSAVIGGGTAASNIVTLPRSA